VASTGSFHQKPIQKPLNRHILLEASMQQQVVPNQRHNNGDDPLSVNRWSAS
jgi:hypothetical protein